MRAIVLSIGDEVLAGDCVDTNASWLCARLAACGIKVEVVHQLPDDRPAICSMLTEAAGRVDLVVTTGGLGLTPDDMTREAMADAFDGGRIVRDSDAVDWIRERLAGRGMGMSDLQAAMARRPADADCLRNPVGTAPILRRRVGSCTVWCLPGPPVEVHSTFDTHVAPSLPEAGSIASREVRCCGIIEAEASPLLGDLLDRDRPIQVGTRVSRGVFIVTVHESGPEADDLLAEIRSRLRPWAFGIEGEQPAHDVARMLLERSQSLATAESCTGGGIGSSLVDVPGSSSWYRGGVVAYSNELKQHWLSIAADRFSGNGPGAVSGEVAMEMADGIRSATGSDWGLSVTGIAGPDGGTDEKPVGTVWFGVASSQAQLARRFQFPGDRTSVRSRSVLIALQCLRMAMLGERSPMTWECT